MSYYGDLFLEEYGIVEEKFEVVGKGLKALFSYENKTARNLIKSAYNYEKKGDYDSAIKDYNEALKHLQKVRSEANKIGDDGGWSWIWKLCVQPKYVTIGQFAYSEGNLKHVTRDSTLKLIDLTIKDIKTSIKRCESSKRKR